MDITALKQQKCLSVRSGKIHIVTEPWTSKKCSGCHHLKMDLKGSRLYECDNCGLKMHRDLNSAFNIYIKNLESCLQSQVEINSRIVY